MTEIIYSAGLIILLRIGDVSLGTLRTILTVQSKKYYAGAIGFTEVLIWIFAMRYIVQHMDSTINLISYATGFGLGTVIGITIEQIIGIGYAQVNIISRDKAEEIARLLRATRYGVTMLPGNGKQGEVSIIYTVINKKRIRKLKELINKIDRDVFINIQPAEPIKGFIHGSRK
jgi:uncharacterized protein YebE (UPF0316 family)